MRNQQKLKRSFTKSASITMNDFNEIHVSMDYDEDAIKFFRTVIGRRFDFNSKQWVFPKNRFTDIVEKLKEMNFEIDCSPKNISNSPNHVVIERNNDLSGIIEIQCPFDTKITPILKKHANFNKNSKVWIVQKDNTEALFVELARNAITVTKRPEFRVNEETDLTKINVSLHEFEDGFEVRFTPFSLRVKDIIKEISGTQFLPEKRAWKVPLDCKETLSDRLSQNNIKIFM